MLLKLHHRETLDQISNTKIETMFERELSCCGSKGLYKVSCCGVDISSLSVANATQGQVDKPSSEGPKRKNHRLSAIVTVASAMIVLLYEWMRVLTSVACAMLGLLHELMRVLACATVLLCGNIPWWNNQRLWQTLSAGLSLWHYSVIWTAP